MKKTKQTFTNAIKDFSVKELKSLEKSTLSNIKETKLIISDAKKIIKRLNTEVSKIRKRISNMKNK